jgi:PIN domain-containing protein
VASFTVVYDACVLYPAPLRDLLMRIGSSGIVRARWSSEILDEMVNAILERRPELHSGNLTRTRQLMCDAVPDCLVQRYESLIETIDLPDATDRHVVAAAIRCGAQAIVTFNLKDFPDHVLARWDIEAKHPDEFVMESIDISPGVVVRCLTEQALALRNPPQSVEEVLTTLAKSDLVQSCARLRDLLGAGPLG